MKEYSTWIRVFLGKFGPKSNRNEGIIHMGQTCLGQM